MDYIRVGSFVEVPEGELRAYELPSGRVAVAHVEQRLFAVGDECPYAGCSLAEEGTLSDAEDAVSCDNDGSTFDLETGEPIDGPASDPIRVFPVRVQDGWIEIGGHAGEER